MILLILRLLNVLTWLHVPHCMPSHHHPVSELFFSFWQSINHKQRMEKQNSQSPKYISYSIKNTQILPFIAIALSHCGVNTGIWLVTKSLNITIYLVTRFYEFDQKWALFFVSVNVWVTSSPCLHSFNFWLIDIFGIIW